MKKIPLTQGKFAIVDDEDFVFLNRLKWHCSLIRGVEYDFEIPAMSFGSADQKKSTRYFPMVNLLIRTKPNMVVVHKNKNSLDCRKENLAMVLRGNKIHFRKKKGGTYSKFRGVFWDKSCNKWRGSIMKDGRAYFLGASDDEGVIAKKYNEKARELYGEFAYQNTIT